MIADILKRQAKKLGLKDAEIARKLEISPRRYAHYTSGRSEPNLELLKNICQVLCIDPIEIFENNTQVSSSDLNTQKLIEAIKLVERDIIDNDLAISRNQKADLIVKTYQETI